MKALVKFDDIFYLVETTKDLYDNDVPDREDLRNQVNVGRYPDESFSYSDIGFVEAVCYFNDDAELRNV